jgi:hypothetical protein
MTGLHVFLFRFNCDNVYALIGLRVDHSFEIVGVVSTQMLHSCRSGHFQLPLNCDGQNPGDLVGPFL